MMSALKDVNLGAVSKGGDPKLITNKLIKGPIPPSVQKMVSLVFEKLRHGKFLDRCKNLLTSKPSV